MSPDYLAGLLVGAMAMLAIDRFAFPTIGRHWAHHLRAARARVR